MNTVDHLALSSPFSAILEGYPQFNHSCHDFQTWLEITLCYAVWAEIPSIRRKFSDPSPICFRVQVPACDRGPFLFSCSCSLVCTGVKRLILCLSSTVQFICTQTPASAHFISFDVTWRKSSWGKMEHEKHKFSAFYCKSIHWGTEAPRNNTSVSVHFPYDIPFYIRVLKSATLCSLPQSSPCSRFTQCLRSAKTYLVSPDTGQDPGLHSYV